MERGLQNVKLSSTVVSDVSLGKSSHHFTLSTPLRMINSLDASSKQNASFPSRMEVNSGKSAHHSPFNPCTLKDCTRTNEESTTTKEKRFQLRQVYSSFHLCKSTSHDQFTCCIMLETENTTTKSNQSQCRQVYSSLSL